MKSITLCADDYAQNQAVTNGILNLIDNSRISATSCMTNMENWLTHSYSLKSRNNVDRGVHLNFTHGKPLSTKIKNVLTEWPQSPATFLGLCLKGTLKANDLEEEIKLQIDAYEQAIGEQPDFLDGHQHIHHFPYLRAAFLTVYKQKYLADPSQIKPYVRTSYSKTTGLLEPFWLKKYIINMSGSRCFRKKLSNLNIPTNKSFAGVYDFSPKVKYENIFKKEQSLLCSNGLMMCHPGLESCDESDPIRHARVNEYNFLSSQAFKSICQSLQIEIKRFQS